MGCIPWLVIFLRERRQALALGDGSPEYMVQQGHW